MRLPGPVSLHATSRFLAVGYGDVDLGSRQSVSFSHEIAQTPPTAISGSSSYQYIDGSITYQALWSADQEALAPHFIDLPRFGLNRPTRQQLRRRVSVVDEGER